MSFQSPKSGNSAVADDAPSGLSAEHKVALGEAASMISNGRSTDDAVAHLVDNDMPRMVAKVLVKQYDKRKAS